MKEFTNTMALSVAFAAVENFTAAHGVKPTHFARREIVEFLDLEPEAPAHVLYDIAGGRDWSAESAVTRLAFGVFRETYVAVHRLRTDYEKERLKAERDRADAQARANAPQMMRDVFERDVGFDLGRVGDDRIGGPSITFNPNAERQTRKQGQRK